MTFRILLFSFFLCARLFAQNESSNTLAIDSVNEVVADLINDKKLAGAVTLVAHRGKVIHFQAHGMRSLKTGEAMTTDTIFRIHSMTKAIVSAAALQLHEQGKFALSNPVSKFIPTFADLLVFNPEGAPVRAKNAMRVEDLFRHTSGLAYDFTAPPELSKQLKSPAIWGGDLETFCDELAKIPLVHEPGEAWTYGVSTDVLGRLVEVWSGTSLDEYLAANLFEPLQMSDTGFWIKTDEGKKRFAGTHALMGGKLMGGGDLLGKRYFKKPTLMSGGGGLVSTANDYYKFLQMIADKGTAGVQQILTPESVAMMTSSRLPESIPQIYFGNEQRTRVGFGLGFSVVTGLSEGWDESAPVGEYGWGGAASCHYWVSPEDEDLIVITLEQTFPYNWNLERAIKPIVYEFVRQG